MHIYKILAHSCEYTRKFFSMKDILILRHNWKVVTVQAFFTSTLAFTLSALAPQALACGSGAMLPRINISQMLLPTVADRMDHWDSQYALTEGDSLFILLSNGAKVTILGDKDNPAIEQFEEGDKRFSENMRQKLNQPGYTWRSFLATKPGSSSINIDAGEQKKTLTLNVNAYTPRMEPLPSMLRAIALDQATREKPVFVSVYSDLQITLPGDLKEGWSVNDTSESGVELKNASQFSASGSSNHPQVRLTFYTVGRDREEPYHLVIKRGGLFSGESFHFYINIIPARKC